MFTQNVCFTRKLETFNHVFLILQTNKKINRQKNINNKTNELSNVLGLPDTIQSIRCKTLTLILSGNLTDMQNNYFEFQRESTQ